ncbi:hypothetical protein [Muricoccus vinaceus]|uniref:Uncharacterized protein n=1 Tax=Muricoccus vinaceus TaxID=424704 RepID=A0ABV6IKV9_9PROT
MRRRPPKPARGMRHRSDPKAEIVQLRRELEEARARLHAVEQNGADDFLRRRLSELEEHRQVARGQAVEATVAKSRAEAELRALKDAIAKAPGVWGWLLRKAQRRLEER